MKNWILGYRKGMGGYSEGVIEASSYTRALEVARAWCRQEPDRRFVTIKDPVLADESILEEPPPEAVPEVDNFKDLSVTDAINCVRQGGISSAKAIEIERSNKNRSSLLKLLGYDPRIIDTKEASSDLQAVLG
jgi:hypothetical protein